MNTDILHPRHTCSSVKWVDSHASLQQVVILWFSALNFSTEDVHSLLPVKAHGTVFRITFECKTFKRRHLKTNLYPLSNSYWHLRQKHVWMLLGTLVINSAALWRLKLNIIILLLLFLLLLIIITRSIYIPVSCCRRFFSSKSRPTTPEDFVTAVCLCSVLSALGPLVAESNAATSISSAELDSSPTRGIYKRK